MLADLNFKKIGPKTNDVIDQANESSIFKLEI